MKITKKITTLLVSLLCFVFLGSMAAMAAENLSPEQIAALTQTTVYASEDSPTGYYVKFCYEDPSAERVRLMGEFAFSDPLYTTVGYSQNRSPEEWKNGDTITGNKTIEMELDSETGVWTCTIPLPCGTYGYYFVVNGAPDAEIDDYTDAQKVSDPSNLQFLADYTGELSNDQIMSFVYVPYDEEKQSLSPDLSIEAPRDGENGEAFYVQLDKYDSPFYYGVYLPYEFDAEREEAYPILVLIGNAYSQWFNNGTIINILDNCIAENKMEPTILVTLTGEGFENEETYDVLLNTILPEVSSQYNGSTDPQRRAIGGLSASGARSMYGYFHYTDEFQYYLIMSPPMKTETMPDYEAEGLADRTLFIGFGDYDQVLLHYVYSMELDEDGNLVTVRPAGSYPSGNIYEYIYNLGKAGIAFQSMQLPYGHSWALWRQLAAYGFENVLWK